MIRAGLARTLKLFLAIAGSSAVIGLLAGAALGAGVARSLSVAWYCAGAFLLAIAFVASSRGPTRAADTGTWAPVSLRARSLRWASRHEQEESINLSAVLVVLGFGLIAIGVVADPRHPLF